MRWSFSGNEEHEKRKRIVDSNYHNRTLSPQGLYLIKERHGISYRTKNGGS